MPIRSLTKLWPLIILGLIVLSSPARAFGDCPLVGSLENFEAGQAPRITNYDAVEFRVVEGGEAKTVVKMGKVCRQDYGLKQGQKPMSGLEIMQNYAEGLPADGMKITNSNRANDDDVFATITKGGSEYWIHVWESNGDGVHVQTLQVASFRNETVAAGDKDCPLVPIQKNFQTSERPRILTYDVEEFIVGDERVKKTGRVCKQDYGLKPGVAVMSGLEIMQTYAEALPAAGMKITNVKRGADDEVDATINKDGKDYWLRVWESNGDGLHVLVVEVAAFHASLVAAGAQDCPLMPIQQNFQTSNRPYARTYDVEEFRVADGGEDKIVKKFGKVCKQDYGLKPGVGAMSALEIMSGYAEAAPAAGMTITNSHRSPEDEIYATMTKDGAEYWLHVWESNGDGLHITALLAAPFHSTIVAATPKDCPLVPSIESFQADEAPQIVKFDTMDFRVADGDQDKTVTKKGKICKQNYHLKSGVGAMSALEIMQNYAEALPAAGLAIANTHRGVDDEIDATMTKDGVESWVHVWESNGDGLHVDVLQIEPFHSTLKKAQPAEETPPPPPPTTKLKITATRGGEALAEAWCGVFAVGATGGEPLSRAASGQVQEDPTATYDVGCFLQEDGKTTSGWLRGQALAPGEAELTVDLPAPPKKHAAVELALPAPAAEAEKVAADEGDFPYLPSLPGSTLTGGKASSAPFFVQPADAKQPELVANGSIVKEYDSPPGVTITQLFVAYRDALLKGRWTIVGERRDEGVTLTSHYGLNSRNIWAVLHLGQKTYTIAVADATLGEGKLEADLGAQCHFALTGVLFDFNKSKLKPESDPVLQQVSAVMAKNPALKLEVQGHTDSVGSQAFNLPLSEARAKAVVEWLENHDVDPDRLSARGLGKTKPVAPNDTDEGRAKNRRVEISNPACKAAQ